MEGAVRSPVKGWARFRAGEAGEREGRGRGEGEGKRESGKGEGRRGRGEGRERGKRNISDFKMINILRSCEFMMASFVPRLPPVVPLCSAITAALL